MNRDVVRATLFVALSACCFGSIPPLTVLALEDGMALPANQAWRYGTTALLMLAYASWRSRRSHSGVGRRSRDNESLERPSLDPPGGTRSISPWYSPPVMLLAGGGQALIATLALSAIRFIPAATEAFLFYTFPAWVALITATRGIERIDRHRAIALILALSGVAIMVGTPVADTLHPAGVALALAAALVYAAYIPMLDSLQRERPPLDVVRAIAVGGTVVFLIWSVATNSLWQPTTLRAVGTAVLQGVLSTGAFLGFLAGLATLGPVRTAITSTIEPFWTSLLGVVLLGQSIGPETYLGGVAIVGAVLLLQRQSVARQGLHSSTSHEGDRSGHPFS